MGLDMMLYGKDSDGSLTEIAYWRKANHIHKWFVDNVQNGIDQCQKSPATREQLQKLLQVCEEVSKSIQLIDGYVYNGMHLGPDTGGQLVTDYIEGQVIAEPEIAEKLLPTQEGFFFGSVAYDQWYYEDVENTIKMIKDALNSDFQEFVYQSSW